MKVIQILPELNSGGVERGTLELGKHLVEHGHQSLVISNGGRLIDKLQNEGSKHLSLAVHRKHPSTLFLISKLREIFTSEKPDIIHIRSRVPAWITWLAWKKMPRNTRPRLVSTVHGFYSVNRYSKIMTQGEKVICVSNSIREYVTKNYPSVSKDKLSVIHRGVSPLSHPNGFNPDTTWQLKNKFIVTLPGRLTRWKGPLDFIQIIRLLKDAGIPVHGLLVGDAHPRKLQFKDEITSSIENAGLNNDITLLGHRADIREIMSVSDAVISCSTDPEAFGRVTLEALSLGKPVAGYDHGGVREQLDALLPEGKIPIGDTHAMAKLLEQWHQSPTFPKQENTFTLDNMLTQTLSVYQALLPSNT